RLRGPRHPFPEGSSLGAVNPGPIAPRPLFPLTLVAMEGQSLISPEVVARYARDAAEEIPGVRVPAKGVRVEAEAIELRLAVEWGRSIPEVCGAVQERVGDYLARMTAVRPAVNVVVEEIDGDP